MSSKESQIGGSTNEEDSLSQYAMQLATASVLPMVLKAAIEIGVLEILDIELVLEHFFLLPK